MLPLPKAKQTLGDSNIAVQLPVVGLPEATQSAGDECRLARAHRTGQRQILGTKRNDTLQARAEGDIVFGREGNDNLSSAFNRTALVGGDGGDTLTSAVAIGLADPSVPVTEPLHGLIVQLGGAGQDHLSAQLSMAAPGGTGAGDVMVDGGDGQDSITVSTAPGTGYGGVELNTHVLGGSGDDVIDIVGGTRDGGASAYVTNTVDAGTGDDQVTVSSETTFFGLSGNAVNVVWGGDGRDSIDATRLHRQTAPTWHRTHCMEETALTIYMRTAG